MLDGLAEELDAAGRSMLLVAQPVEDPERALAQLATQAVDAAVFPLCGERDNPVVDHLLARGVPLVGSGAPVHPRVAHVLTDEAAAMRLATATCSTSATPGSRTCRWPCAPGRPPGRSPSGTWRAPPTRMPRAGSRGSARSPATTPRSCRRTTSPSRPGRPRPDCSSTCPRADRPTAVVAQADLLAAGAVRAAEALGLRVPDDLSVTGFDGVDLPWLDHVLTTVEQPGADKGRPMGRLVRQALEGRPIADQPFPVRLRVGTTSSSPPSVHRLSRRWRRPAAPLPSAAAVLAGVQPGAAGAGSDGIVQHPSSTRSAPRSCRAPALASVAAADPPPAAASLGWRSKVPAASMMTCIEPARCRCLYYSASPPRRMASGA